MKHIEYCSNIGLYLANDVLNFWKGLLKNGSKNRKLLHVRSFLGGKKVSANKEE